MDSARVGHNTSTSFSVWMRSHLVSSPLALFFGRLVHLPLGSSSFGLLSFGFVRSQQIQINSLLRGPFIMARKAKKTAVAHARAFCHTKHHPAEPNDTQPAGHDDDDAENECGYEGGVNCYWSKDSDYAPDSDSDWSDGDESVLASVSINTI
ncbi:hypothetical protein EV424DRAFT_1538125 [Suillus variegatus]|nr:hypothetical protein EV424DRAFT_1538125 [Suillus variegatus]